MRFKSSKASGFSLVEVLCAILILGVGVTGLTLGMSTALRSSKDSEMQTSAALIAAGLMETMRAEGYVVAGESEGECDPGFELYQWRQSIVETSVEGLFDVKVVVTLTQTGQTIYELQTLLFDPPVYSVPYETEDEDENSSGTGRAQGGTR